MSKIGFSISLLSLIASTLCLAGPTGEEHNEEKNSEIQDVTYLGAQLGQAFDTSSGGGNRFTFSGRLGTGIYKSNYGIFSLGLFAGSMPSDSTFSGKPVSGSTTTLAAEVLARRLCNTGFYLGGRFGIGSTSLNIDAPNIVVLAGQATRFAVGPFVGYEFLLAKHWNFTTDFSWMNLASTSMSLGTLGYLNLAANSNIQLQVGVVYAWGGDDEKKAGDIRTPASVENHVGQRWSLFEGWVDKKEGD